MRANLLDRRTLLATMAGGLAAAPGAWAAQPFFKRHGLPIGIQIYTLGPEPAKDLEATLAAISRIGYRSVELAGFLGRTPAQMKAALERAGLACVSAHAPARATGPDGGFTGDLGKLADGLGTLGVKTVVMSSPLIPARLESRPLNGEGVGDWLRRVVVQLTADDWKATADLLNRTGRALKTSGLMAGYHNHNFEFAPLAGGQTGMQVLLDNTDRSLVTFEMDVGWVAAAGVDPLALLNRHRGRFGLMHVKDIKASTQPNYGLRMDPTEVGSGRIDWKALLSAAHAAGVRGFYVEQEPPFARPRIEAAKISHDFLAGVAS